MCLVLALCCASSSLAGEPPEFVFVPDPDVDGAAMLSGATWVATGPDFTLHIQRIGEEERRAFIEKITGSPTDPFASPPGKPPGFVTFVMELANQGAGNLVFRSQQCWLVTDKHEILHPIGMEGLRARYGLVGQEMGPAYERSVTAVIPTTRTLYTGDSLAGLLVYRAFKPKTKRYRLDIQITTASGDVSKVIIPYRRIKKERSENP
jgi:hypothetical protein